MENVTDSMQNNEKRPMVFLSLGAGVQSSVMLMLAINGEIERPDHVIFADTGWEPEKVYDHVKWCKKQCLNAGIPFHRVSAGNIREDMMNARCSGTGGEYSGRWASMPLFTMLPGAAREGAIRRQCTSEYKIAPMRAKQRELLGYKPRQRIPASACSVMIGISVDESRRARVSRDKWVDNLYPLIDPLKMSRADCQAWWQAHFPHVTLSKSACLGCPFTNDNSWLHMSVNSPAEFEDVCVFDEQIRHLSDMDALMYIHRSCVPLRDVNLNGAQNELDLEDELYCAGGCGL